MVTKNLYFIVPVASDSVELLRVELDAGLVEEEWDSVDQWSRSEYSAVAVLSDSQCVPYRCGLSNAR